MSFMDRLRITAKEAPPPAFCGRWRPLQFLPSLHSGERVNVGVALFPVRSQPVVKLIPHFDRIKCAYGEAVAGQAAFGARVALDDIMAGRRPSSPLLRLGRSQHLEAHDLSQAMTLLMDYMAPLARPMRAEPTSLGVTIKTRKLRKDVATIIKTRSGTDADQLLAQNPSLEFADGGAVRYLDVPLQGPDRFGTLIAVTAKDANINMRNASYAAQQIETAAADRKVANKGIFMLRPSEGDFPMDVMQQIDESMDTLVWMFRKQGVYATAELSPEQIAAAVMEWGGIRAVG